MASQSNSVHEILSFILNKSFWYLFFNLKPGSHCTQVAIKADARAKRIMKSLLSLDVSCLTTEYYITYALSLLEDATLVYG